MITEKAFAKINLTLSVGKKRKDGYHDIDSVMHSISLHDKITLEKSGEISLSVTKGSAPSGQENLMWKAAELFLQKPGFPAASAWNWKSIFPHRQASAAAPPMRRQCCAD
ncbi:MAG: hypothetical protein ACLR1D_04175 [Dialister sp.]